MKKIIKITCVLAVCLSVLAALVSCGDGEKDTSDTLKVGIIQYMSHPSLDNCYEGVKEALESAEGSEAFEKKIEIDYKTGSASSADSDCMSFAKNMVADGVDMIIAIATPAAKAAYAACADTDIPVIFCAVSDPVAAGLVETLDAPGELCTGTADILDLAEQLRMIKAFQPNVESIGILYTSSEDNSISNLAVFKALCDAENIEVVAKAVQNSADVPSAAADLAARVDCINNFTDNNVVNNLSAVLSAAEANGIPVYGSEIEQVKNGCLGSMSMDYVSLGRETGSMALEVLDGADPSKMPVRTVTGAVPAINEDVLASLGLAVPEELDTDELEMVSTN